jgi:hypothetical protein
MFMSENSAFPSPLSLIIISIQRATMRTLVIGCFTQTFYETPRKWDIFANLSAYLG